VAGQDWLCAELEYLALLESKNIDMHCQHATTGVHALYTTPCVETIKELVRKCIKN
jgi:hypothetical protein